MDIKVEQSDWVDDSNRLVDKNNLKHHKDSWIRQMLTSNFGEIFRQNQERRERAGWINVKDRERLGNDLMPEENNVRGEDYKKGEVHGRYLQTHYHLHLHNMVLY